MPYSWPLSIGATEWGHWLGAGALLIAVLFWKHQRVAAVGLILAALIAFRPTVLALFREHDLAQETIRTWGPIEPPYFSVLRLFLGRSSEEVKVQTFDYTPGNQLDLYTSSTSRLDRTVIVVHGGSWARGSRTDFAPFSRYLAARGFTVASVDYRLAPAHKFPAALDDLEAARAFLVKAGATRFAWLGRSAGAHLALLAGYRYKEPVVAFYPPTDMFWSYEHPSNPRVLDSGAAIRDFMGGTPQEKEEAFRQATPLTQANAPTLLLHGGADDLVYILQSERLRDALQQQHIDCQLVTLPWANHGFDINFNGPSGQLSTGPVLAFLKHVLP